MTPGRSVWTAAHPLSDLTLHHDWDLTVAASESLRLYLHDHGAVPSWNLLLCRGRPELATPYAWTFTWPSLFAYAFPANWDVIALWLTMTLVGFLTLRALLVRWGACRLGAATGAALFCFNGYFASRFNVGHATFPFLHLVPPLMLSFECLLAAVHDRRSTTRPLLSLTGVTWLLFTGGLPHAIFHLYPVFLLLVLSRTVASRAAGAWPVPVRVVGTALTAHAIGILLAAYKVVPVALWQRLHPRAGVVAESYGPAAVLANLTRFVAGPYAVDWVGGRTFPGQFWPLWEYNAYVGAPAVLLAVATLAMLLGRRGRGVPAAPGVLALAGTSAVVGLALSLGNGSGRPAALLRHLPLLGGIRAFPRYQILLVFSIAVLAALGLTRAAAWGRSGGRGRPVLVGLLAAACCVPGVLQTASLVYRVEYLTPAELADMNRLPPLRGVPRFAPGRPHPETHAQASRLFLLRRGYWVANCEEQVRLPWPPVPESVPWVPLSDPPPVRVARLTGHAITLSYSPDLATDVRLHIPLHDGVESTVVPRERRSSAALYARDDLRGRELTLSARFPSERSGWAGSALGLLAGALLLAARRRRRV